MTTPTLPDADDGAGDRRPILEPDDPHVRLLTMVAGQVVADGHEVPAETAVELAGADVEPVGLVARRVMSEWVTEPETVRAAAADFAARKWHGFKFHLVRSPLYAGRLLATAPFGVRRAVLAGWRWRQDPDYRDAMAAIHAGASGNIEHLDEAHRATVKTRTQTLAALAVVVPAAVVLLWLSRPWWLAAALGAVAVGLGVYGRPERSTPIVERATYRAVSFPPFTEDLMIQGLREVLGSKQGKRDIQVVQPPAKTRTGWEAIVIVPGDSAEVAERARKFAGEIGRPPACVWLTTGEGADDGQDHPAGWLKIVVTRRSMKRVQVPDWPLLDAGPVDYFHDPIPIGVNALGEPVTAAMAYKSTAGGGIMGSGKSESMKVQVMGQMSDDRTEGHFYDFKGGRDWLPAAKIAHVYISGSDREDHTRILDDLEEINRRLDNRARTLRDLPDSLAAVRTNTTLAGRADLDLHPILIVIDESQEPFEFSNDADRYLALINRFIKKGRAYAITVVVATQEISKKTLPFASLCHWRHVHQTGPGYQQTDAVLGDGTHRSGIHADKLDAPGLGFFGTTGNYQLVRSYYLPGPGEDGIDDVFTPLCERLAERRRQRGLLTGMAAGDIEPDTDLEGTLDRVARVWAGTPERLQTIDLVARLHQDQPGEYPAPDAAADDIDRAVRTLNSQLRRHRIETTSIRRGASVRQGFRWADITTALDIRATRPDPDTDIWIDDTDHPNDDTPNETGDTGRADNDDTATPPPGDTRSNPRGDVDG